MPPDFDVEVPLGEDEMSTPADLPTNVIGHILKTGSEAYQGMMTDIQHNGAVAHNLARLGATRQFNELDTLESRAHSGVMATPIASPATQTG